MRKYWKIKLAAWIALFFFSVSSLYAQQAATLAEPMGKGEGEVQLKAGQPESVAGVQKGKSSEVNPYSLAIPAKFGSIEEVFQGSPDSPLIVHVQDAHANYEAQVNIKKILNHLSEAYKFRLIQLEGGVSKLDPSVFETAYFAEANLRLADYLMREGRLSGAEAFAIETQDPVELFGVEDRKLYAENLRTFRTVYSHQPEVSEYFKSMRVLAKDLRIKLLNEELLDLARNMEAYAQEKIDLLEYLLYLNKLSEKHDLASLNDLSEIVRFPNLVRIIRLHTLEEQLDDKALKKEAEALKAEFLKKDPSPEAQALLAKLEKKKKGAKPRSYFAKLTALADRNGIDLLSYPQLRIMAEFLILQDEIEHHGLFREVRKLEKILQKQLVKTEDERNLIGQLRSLDLLEQYFKLEVSREKLTFILKRYGKMKPSAIKVQLDALAGKIGVLPSDYSGDVAKIDEYMSGVQYFYQVVLERDRTFVENVVAKVKERKADRTVLITGGFHTEGMATLLREKNISYAIVIPKVDAKQGTENYVKIMTESDSAIGSVFAGSFALGVPTASVDPSNPMGPIGPFVGMLRLSAHLGAGLNFFEIAKARLAKGVLPQEALTVQDLQAQAESAQKFNASQPFLRVRPESVKVEADGTVVLEQTDRININGQVVETKYTITVTQDGFTIQPGDDARVLKGAELKNAPNDPTSLEGKMDAPEGTTEVSVSSLLKLLEQTIRSAQTSERSEVAQLSDAVPYPGVLSYDLGGLLFKDLNVLGLAVLQKLIASGTKIDSDIVAKLEAISQPGTPASQAAIQQIVGGNAAKAELFSQLFGEVTIPMQRVMLIPSLSVEATSYQARATQLVSVVNSLKANPKAVAIVYGVGIQKFAQEVLGDSFKDVADRLSLVDEKIKTDEDAVAALSDSKRIGTVFNLARKIGVESTIRIKLDPGIVRALVPKGDVKAREKVHAQYAGAVQLESNLQVNDVRSNEDFSRAYATVQTRVLDILPASEKEQGEFEKLLEAAGLEGVVKPLGDGQWEISGLATVIANLFQEYLAAREVAIRA